MMMLQGKESIRAVGSEEMRRSYGRRSGRRSGRGLNPLEIFILGQREMERERDSPERDYWLPVCASKEKSASAIFSLFKI